MNFPNSRAWVLAGLWVWTGLVYGYIFRCDFVQDDKEIVFAHIVPREEAGWAIFKRGWWRESLGSTPVSGDHYRPIALLGFKINHMLAGLRAPFWHGVNLLIHLFNIGLLFTVVKKLSGRVLIAGIASGFWAVFPTNVEVVASIVGLADLLAVGFSLAAWQVALSRSTMMRAGICGLLYLLALLSKESALLLPLILCGMPLLGPKRVSLRFRLAVALSCGIAFCLYASLRILALGNLIGSLSAGYFEHQSALTVWLTMASFFVKGYLIPMLTGSNLCANYERPTFPDASWMNIWAWLCLITLLSLFVYSAIRYRRLRGLSAFGALAFFILILPVSNILFRTATLGAERFLYFPSVGIAICLGYLLSSPMRAPTRRKILTLCLLWFLLLSARAFRRTMIWKSDVTFFSELISRAPQNVRGYNGLGTAFLESGEPEKAVHYFQRAVAQAPRYAFAHHNLGLAELGRGNLTQARIHFKQAITIWPGNRDGWIWLGLIAFQQDRLEHAERNFKSALSIDSRSLPAHYDLFQVYLRQGRYEKAKEILERYAVLLPVDEARRVLPGLEVELEQAQKGRVRTGGKRP